MKNTVGIVQRQILFKILEAGNIPDQILPAIVDMGVCR
jgi:hypothetical protein